MRPLLSLLLTLFALLSASSVGLGQSLDARERAWVASVAAVASRDLAKTAPEKETHDGVTDLFVGLGYLNVLITRHANERLAFTAGSRLARSSTMRGKRMFIEVRGVDVLTLSGRRLTQDGLLERLRSASWSAYPWSGAKKKTRLLQLNLLGKGYVLRVNRPSGVAYTYLEGLFRTAKSRAEAQGGTFDKDSDPIHELISANEVRVKRRETRARLKVTSGYGIHVINVKSSPKVLKTFAELVGLPITSRASGGAVGALSSGQ